jgi:hypothetical protein
LQDEAKCVFLLGVGRADGKEAVMARNETRRRKALARKAARRKKKRGHGGDSGNSGRCSRSWSRRIGIVATGRS